VAGKVLSSSNLFVDALHQDRAAEEQKKQLLRVHDTSPAEEPFHKKRTEWESHKIVPHNDNKGATTEGSA